MMDSELDFMKAAVLSRSTEPVFLYSDMPMTEMATRSSQEVDVRHGAAAEKRSAAADHPQH